MKTEILVVTTNLNNYDLHKKMNINSSCIISNQGENLLNKIIYENDRTIKYISNNQIGVGRNRNQALLEATGDIIVFADDDLTYIDNYQSIINYYYEKLPKADMLIFNINSEVIKRYEIKKIKRVSKFNFMRYGAVRLTCKRSSIVKKNIFFPLNFGGGTNIGSGEDSIFIKECLDKKLKIYAVPHTILTLNEDRESTWFSGYDKKYFEDKGKLFKAMFGIFAYIIAVRFALKTPAKFGFITKIKYLSEGIKKY